MLRRQIILRQRRDPACRLLHRDVCRATTDPLHSIWTEGRTDMTTLLGALVQVPTGPETRQEIANWALLPCLFRPMRRRAAFRVIGPRKESLIREIHGH
jgi:hypothetical protein